MLQGTKYYILNTNFKWSHHLGVIADSRSLLRTHSSIMGSPRIELICQHRQQKVLETCCPALFHGWGKACKLSPTRSWIKGYIFFTAQECMPTSFLHCFLLRLRMQQAHHFFVAPTLCQVVRCFASVDRSWCGHCCCFSWPSSCW